MAITRTRSNPVAVLAEHDRPPPARLIPLTRNQIARRAAALIIQPVITRQQGMQQLRNAIRAAVQPGLTPA